MPSQTIEFSTSWVVSNFSHLLDKNCNHVAPSFIISPNFSPFYHRLIDAFIELNVENFEQEQWSGISAYVNLKSYFSEPITVWFQISFLSNNSKLISASLQKNKQVVFHKCGRFGFEDIVKRKHINSHKSGGCCSGNAIRLMLETDLTILCQVKLTINDPQNQKVFVGSDEKPYADQFWLRNYKCPRVVTTPFNAETLLEPFWHSWQVQNCSKLLKLERALKPAIFSETFESSFDDKFSLTLWPNGYRKKAKTQEIAVHLTNDEIEHLARVQWRMWFLNQQNVPLLIYSGNNINGVNHMSAVMINHNLIVNAQTGEPALLDDTLNIYIEGHVVIETERRSIIQNYIHKKSENIFKFETVATSTLTHQWSIENFSEVCNVKKHGTPLLVSSIFSIDGHTQFHLALLPNKREEDGCNKYMSLFIRCDNPPSEETFLQGKAFLMNNKGKRFNEKLLFRKLESIITNKKFGEFISIESFQSSKETYLNENKLIIYFEGEILLGKNLKITDYYNNLAIFDSKELLPADKYNSFSTLNTTPKMIQFTHKWTISDYHVVCQKGLNSLESLFSPEKGTEEKLQLAVILYPFGLEKEDGNTMSILLHLKSFSKEHAIIQYRFSVLNKKGKKVLSEENINFFDISSEKATFGFKEFMAIGKLFKQKKELLPNNKLTIYCEGQVILEDDISVANLSNYYQIFIKSQMPVIDCIATDNNVNLFEYEETFKKENISESIQRKISIRNVDFDQDLLKTYRGDMNFFFNTNNNINNPQLFGSILTVDSEVKTENINCLNEIRENKFKDLEKEARNKANKQGTNEETQPKEK